LLRTNPRTKRGIKSEYELKEATHRFSLTDLELDASLDQPRPDPGDGESDLPRSMAAPTSHRCCGAAPSACMNDAPLPPFPSTPNRTGQPQHVPGSEVLVRSSMRGSTPAPVIRTDQAAASGDLWTAKRQRRCGIGFLVAFNGDLVHASQPHLGCRPRLQRRLRPRVPGMRRRLRWAGNGSWWRAWTRRRRAGKRN
jgi:hypothetical protein